jgi:hypothetical protein
LLKLQCARELCLSGTAHIIGAIQPANFEKNRNLIAYTASAVDFGEPVIKIDRHELADFKTEVHEAAIYSYIYNQARPKAEAAS